MAAPKNYSVGPIVKHIVDGLFSSEHTRLAKNLHRFFRNNSEAWGELFDGFHYQGKFYQPEGLRGHLKRKVLHHNLHKDMDSYLADRDHILSDEQQIRQTLFRLMDPCNTEQDIRNTLPECLIQNMNWSGSQLQRTGEEAFTIRDNDRAYKQYLKILPTIQVYSSARLLY